MNVRINIGVVFAVVVALVIIVGGCASAPESTVEVAEASSSGERVEREPAGDQENPFEPLTGFTGETVVFQPDLSDPMAAEQQMEYWGTVDPFNRVEVFDGAIEFEGSNGMEAFGVFFAPEFDLGNGPLSISMDVVRNSEQEGSEICIWYVNQYMVDGDPWTQGDFLRVMLLSTGNQLVVQETNFEERGVGKDIAKKFGVFEMGQPLQIELRLSPEAYLVFIDGEEVARGVHNLPEPVGYLHIHDWNSLEGNIDTVSNIGVKQ